MKTWFSGKPKKLGFYWFTKKDGSKSIAHFHDENSGKFGFSIIGYDGPIGLIDFKETVLWSGPLVPPKIEDIKT